MFSPSSEDRLSYQMLFSVVFVITASVILSYWASQILLTPFLIGMAAIIVFFFTLTNINLAIVLIIFFMLLSPEISVGGVPGRDVVVRVEDLLIFICCIVWIMRTAADKGLNFVEKTPLNRFIAFYSAIFILSTARGIITSGVNPLKGMFYILKYLEYFVIYFLGINLIRNKKQIKTFTSALLITFAIVIIYAWSQIGLVGRVSAPFEGGAGEPNTLGGYQVLMLAVTLGILFYAKSKRLKFLLTSLTAITIYPFLQTLSRASYTAIIPMYLTFVVFNKSKRLFLIAILIVGIVLAIFFMPAKVTERVAYTFKAHEQGWITPVKVLGFTLGPSASARAHSWWRVLLRWRESPYFGFGITGTGFLDSQYIRTLGELGIIGFSAFIMILVSIFRNTLRIYRTTQDNFFKGLSLGLLAGHVGMIFHALTANTFILIRIMESYWFLVAMVMVIPRIERLENTNAEIEKELKENNYRNSSYFLNYGKSS